MKLKNGATYRLLNRADGDRSLNVFGNRPASQANVCLWSSNSNDICQQWIYKEEGNRKYFLCKGNTGLALDLFTGSSSGANVTNYNAHVYRPTDTSAVEIEYISNSYIRIKLSRNGKYLTANQGKNGSSAGKDVNAAGNVYFYKGGLTDYSQDWKPILLEDGQKPEPDPDPKPEPGDTTPTPIDPPNNIESVNIMQRYNAPLSFTGPMIDIKNVGNDSSVEYYHCGSGFRPSEGGMNFLDTENGNTILSTIQNFAKTVFRLNYLPDRRKTAYYLFGEYDSSAKFHHGVDMNIKDGEAIRPFWGGKVISMDGPYGNVNIYVPELGVTTIYLHMNRIAEGGSFKVGETIGTDMIIGHQSDVSTQDIESHLHFEVRQGVRKSAGDNTVSSKNAVLTSIVPYGYMKK